MSFGIPFEEVLCTIFDTIWTPKTIQNERASALAQQLQSIVNNASGDTSGKSETKQNWSTKTQENAKPTWNTAKMRKCPQHRAKMGPGIDRRRATTEVEIQKRQS